MSAMMAVMRKMVAVTTHLMKTGEDYDPSKVWVGTTQTGITLRQVTPYRAASRGHGVPPSSA